MTVKQYALNQELAYPNRKASSGARMLYGTSQLWMGIALGLSDLFSLCVAIYAALLIYQLPEKISDPAYQQFFFLLAVILGAFFGRNKLYPAQGVNRAEELRRIVMSVSYGFLIMIGITFLLKTSVTYSRVALMISWALSLFTITVGRFLTRRLLIKLNLWGEPVAVIGDLDKAMPLASYFQRMPQFGLKPVAVLRDNHCSSNGFSTHPPLSVEEIQEYASSQGLRTALLVANDLNKIDSLVDRYRFVFKRVILTRNQVNEYGLNSLEPLDFSDVLGLQVKHNLLQFTSQVTKRAIDIAVSALGLLVLSPIFFVIGMFIRFGSPGPLTYRNSCVGRGERSFGVLKFRTMYENSDEILKELLKNDPAVRQEWEKYHKLRDDPRITTIGRLLRKYSVDELPQLWNVLVGEMSLVGPRPMKDWEAREYGPNLDNYLKVTPGISGLWQVSGRNNTTFSRRAQLDCEYIQRWSVWMDVHILVRTVMVVLSRDGAC